MALGVDDMKSGDGSGKLSRRHFLSVTAMDSAICMMSPKRMAGLEIPEFPTSYAALQSLPPGAIRPEGWLRGWLEKQANELAISLPRVSEPFMGAYWAGDEKPYHDGWWAWEDKAYWTDGAIRCALTLKDERLLRAAMVAVDYTLNHPAADGYLGPAYLLPPKKDNYRFSHNIFFRAMAATSEAGDNKRIVEAIKQHYLGRDDANYGVVHRNVVNMETMLWCYELCGDPRLLAKAEQAWSEYQTQAGEPIQGDLAPARVFANTPINAHGVTYAVVSKLPALLYMHTGKENYIKFAVAAQQRIFDRHMLVDGGPSTSEWFHGTTSLDAHETCDIADYTWSWGYLLMATGNGAWEDRVERASFNAGFGAIKKDWKGLHYFSSPNQVLATLDSNHTVDDRGTSQMAYQPNPGHHVSCCAGNVHRIHPNYVARMWMKHGRDGLAATLYGTSRVKTTAGAGRQPIEIVQKTNYSFDATIHLSFHSAKPVSFPLYLRIPQRYKNPTIAENGKPVAPLEMAYNFAVLSRTFQPGDTITPILPMKTAVTSWPQNGIAVEHSPLVYALPITASWTSAMEQPWSTPDFPEWIANPESAWNYGLILDSSHPDAGAELRRKAMTSGPWTGPPLSLDVNARKIDDWRIQQSSTNPQQRFTPPLPNIRSAQVSDSVEKLTLVPYGSTHLRMTIFPHLAPSLINDLTTARS